MWNQVDQGIRVRRPRPQVMSFFQTPVKNSSPLANYSFTTPSNDSADAQDDTFVQKFGPSRQKTSNTNGLLQLAAMNNLSTPKKQPPQAAEQYQHAETSTPKAGKFFSTPVKLEPLVNSPFKARNTTDTQVHMAQNGLFTKPSNSNLLSNPAATKADALSSGSSRVQTGFLSSQRSIFRQEPGRFNNVQAAQPQHQQNGSFNLLNPASTSFQPVLDDNVVAAMSRLQNKELSAKKFITNLFAALILQLLNSLVKFLYYNTSVLDWAYDHVYNARYVTWFNWIIVAWILVNLTTSALRLLQRQDQCLDLNLNNDQRKLLGLQPLISDEQDTEPMPLKDRTPVKQIIQEQKELDTLGRTNELLQHLKISTTPRK